MFLIEIEFRPCLSYEESMERILFDHLFSEKPYLLLASIMNTVFKLLLIDV